MLKTRCPINQAPSGGRKEVGEDKADFGQEFLQQDIQTASLVVGPGYYSLILRDLCSI